MEGPFESFATTSTPSLGTNLPPAAALTGAIEELAFGRDLVEGPTEPAPELRGNHNSRKRRLEAPFSPRVCLCSEYARFWNDTNEPW